MEQRLKKMTEELNLESYVTFRGNLPQDEVKSLLAKSTLCIAPCIKGTDGNQDALPTVLLESMALETPCLSTPIGGIPEIIHNEEEGWIVPQRSPEALAEVMMRSLENPGEVRKKGVNARQRIEKDFDQQKNVNHLASWFRASAGQTMKNNDEETSERIF